MRVSTAHVLAAALVITLLGAGCNPDRNKLLFKPQAGSKRNIGTEEAMSYTVNLMGANISLAFSRECDFELETKSVEPDGNVTFDVTISDIKAEVSGLDSIMGGRNPMGRANFPTAGDDPTGMKTLAAELKNAKGEKFTVKVNRLGEVLEVSGVDAIAEKIASKSGEKAAPLPKMARLFLNDAAMKNTLYTAFFPRPDTALRGAASWKGKKTANFATVNVVSDDTVTVKDRANGKANLDNASQLSIQLNTDTAGDMTKNLNLQIEITGQGTGTGKIDETTGWLTEWTSTAPIKGSITAQSPMGNGKISLPVEGSFKVTVSNNPA